MNTPVTKITTPTDQLRALLPEEALIEIQRVAVEKVTETLHKKMAKEAHNISGAIRDAIKADMNRATSEMSVSWTFPQAGKTVVENLVAKALQTQIRSVIDKAADSAVQQTFSRLHQHEKQAETNIITVVQKAINERMAAFDKRIESKARAEFLAVLKEAKEAGL
jgi:hypothetical protein